MKTPISLKNLSKRQRFILEVTHEVKMLKKHATQQELDRLNFDFFNYNSTRNCIYGQMTGSCDSSRAKQLMDASCIRIVINDPDDDISDKSISSKDFKINGKYNDELWKQRSNRFQVLTYLSALEGYICTKDANVKGIFNYLQGKSKKLEL